MPITSLSFDYDTKTLSVNGSVWESDAHQWYSFTRARIIFSSSAGVAISAWAFFLYSLLLMGYVRKLKSDRNTRLFKLIPNDLAARGVLFEMKLLLGEKPESRKTQQVDWCCELWVEFSHSAG
jgi:hypothetical protein